MRNDQGESAFCAKRGVPLVPAATRPATWHAWHARIRATPVRRAARRLPPPHPVVTGPGRLGPRAAGLGDDEPLLLQGRAQLAVGKQ